MRCKSCGQNFLPVKMKKCATTYGLDMGVIIDFTGVCKFCKETVKSCKVVKV
jgi:hypothetical protein